MAMATPGWQTEELVEEWVESSPSPPPTTLPKSFPAKSLPRNVDSVHAKRGSLRGLGHAPARGLPTSRSSSSVDDTAKIMAKRDVSGLLSPPSSRSSSEEVEQAQVAEGSGTVAGPGTFLVKDGVDDDRGKHLLRNQAKSKDIFGALPLERMFRPPSPPPAPVVPEPAPVALVSPPIADGHNRRTSHQYAPANPSRLCKSITPSNCSSSFTDPSQALGPGSQANESLVEDDSVLQDETAPQAEYTTTESHPLAQSTTPRYSPARQDESPTLPQSEFSFTYEPPSQMGGQPAFDPNEISHSTVHGGRHPERSGQDLRLFRSTYDTYTRDHLSALVDSIAIEQSNSQSPSRGNESEEHSPMSSPLSDEQSGSRESGSTSASDMRSSKRLRMSPESPPGRAPITDWGAQGMMMMNKIRIAPESMTSASRSRTTDHSSQRNEATIDYRASPTPPLDLAPSTKPGRQTHRSNPSTTSSGYLRAAEDLMAKIKCRVVSESGSNSDSPVNRIRQALSETDDNAFASSEAETDSIDRKGKARAKPRTGPSPRRLLRRLSASEEIRRIEEETSESEEESEVRGGQQSLDRSARFSNHEKENGAPSPTRPGYNADDLNRFVSSSTYPTNYNTGTTISTSFVKHKGRPPPAPSTLRIIRPDEVADMMPDRVGKMRFDAVGMRWVRDGLGTVDENGESRRESEESEDVFAGMESWRDEVRSLRQDVDAEEDTSQDEHQEEEEGGADRTRQWSDSDTTSISELIESSPAPQMYPNPPSISPPARPVPVHANSAPPILTPRPATSSLPLRAGTSSPPKQLRSALRQPNSTTPHNGGPKKRAGWHADLTPAPARADSKTPVSGRRSVSFSDGKKAGKIAAPAPQQSKWVAADEFFKPQDKNQGEGSWIAPLSERTKRIQSVFQDMEDLSLDDAATPSKPPKQDMSTHTLHTMDDINNHESHNEEDDTAPIVPFGRRSGKSRANETMGQGNATFLTECSFGVAHDKLVQLITDVQPFEPYWEDLKSIDLRGRSVDNLARLKEFLPKLEEVLLDGNRLSYLSGLPSSILNLHASNNKLSSLTSVAHLRRIEILDVSNNQLDSVFQFACLTNLKELKVDGNAITDLHGIADLDGLVKLSVANNCIETLDVSRTKWTLLENLNVSHNQLAEVRGLEKLARLRTLDLDNNKLSSIGSALPMTTVRTLRINDNEIFSVDLSNFPKLRTLYADGNCISRLSRSGFETSRLENLSLRNQRCSQLRLSRSELSPVKRLYVSGNALPSDFFANPLPTLLYLEAAACSLSSLPADMSAILSNLKVLNLNYNYFSSLEGLSNMVNLRKLTVVGCRLGGREKGIVKCLKGLSSLEELDLRMNPSTLSFYLPLFSQPHPMMGSTESNPTDALPRDKSYIQPTTRLNASTNQRAQQAQAESTSTSTPNWSELDAQFRRSLPDEWYSRRLVYRGLVMRACGEVVKLDGVEIGEGERRKAEDLMRRAGI